MAKTPDAPKHLEVDHLEGCPDSRLETHKTVRPAHGDKPSAVVTVTRCIDCGHQAVKVAR